MSSSTSLSARRRMHQVTHTYEKSDSACDSGAVLPRGVQVALTIVSSRLCVLFCFRTSILYGSLERGTHLFALGAFNEPLWKVAHSHTRPLLGSGSLRAYQRRELTHTLELEAFHPFTHIYQASVASQTILVVVL